MGLFTRRKAQLLYNFLTVEQGTLDLKEEELSFSIVKDLYEKTKKFVIVSKEHILIEQTAHTRQIRLAGAKLVWKKNLKRYAFVLSSPLKVSLNGKKIGLGTVTILQDKDKLTFDCSITLTRTSKDSVFKDSTEQGFVSFQIIYGQKYVI
ncbi:MAG: hypothetical protein AABX37_04415 [Nanoarchaeota archaeon]